MHRRHVLEIIGFSAALPLVSSAAALAQQERIGERGQRYMSETLEIGGVALAASRIANERARDRWVKKFAAYEIEEQEGVAAILRSLGAQIPESTRVERQEAVQELRDHHGERFEEAYLRGQEEGHQRLLRVQEEYINGGRNEEVETIAKLVRGRIQEHLDLIRTIRDGLHA